MIGLAALIDRIWASPQTAFYHGAMGEEDGVSEANITEATLLAMLQSGDTCPHCVKDRETVTDNNTVVISNHSQVFRVQAD